MPANKKIKFKIKKRKLKLIEKVRINEINSLITLFYFSIVCTETYNERYIQRERKRERERKRGREEERREREERERGEERKRGKEERREREERERGERGERGERERGREGERHTYPSPPRCCRSG